MRCLLSVSVFPTVWKPTCLLSTCACASYVHYYLSILCLWVVYYLSFVCLLGIYDLSRGQSTGCLLPLHPSLCKLSMIFLGLGLWDVSYLSVSLSDIYYLPTTFPLTISPLSIYLSIISLFCVYLHSISNCLSWCVYYLSVF